METTKRESILSAKRRPVLAAVLAVSASLLVGVYWFAPGWLGVAPKVPQLAPPVAVEVADDGSASGADEAEEADDDQPAKQRPLVVDAKASKASKPATRASP